MHDLFTQMRIHTHDTHTLTYIRKWRARERSRKQAGKGRQECCIAVDPERNGAVALLALLPLAAFSRDTQTSILSLTFNYPCGSAKTILVCFQFQVPQKDRMKCDRQISVSSCCFSSYHLLCVCVCVCASVAELVCAANIDRTAFCWRDGGSFLFVCLSVFCFFFSLAHVYHHLSSLFFFFF
jgi:hypothetical protein